MSAFSTKEELSAVFSNSGRFVDQNLDEPLEFSDFISQEIQGVYYSEKDITFGDKNHNKGSIQLNNALNSGGEWSGIFINKNNRKNFIVTTDHFGYQSLFYSIVKKNDKTDVYVSSSMRSLTSLMQENGVPTEVDWTELLTSLSSNHSWSVTLNSPYSFGVNVSRLTPGQFLYISQERVSIQKNDFFEAPAGSSYESLIKAGIDRAINQLVNISNQDGYQKRIYLSGGKDSRIIMAMLTSAGIAQKFEVTSMNPERWNSAAARPGLREDLRLADAMRLRYGMTWSPEPQMSYHDLNFYESLDYWQEYRSNKNYKFPAQKSLYVPDVPRFELRGAAGETFRYFWSHYLKTLNGYKNAENSTASLSNDIEAVYKDLFDASIMTDLLRAESLDRFENTLRDLGAKTIKSSVNRHFSAYRNRGHFGHINFSRSQAAIPVLPLSQPEFVHAGQLVSEQERESGAMFFDIIESLNPELNDLRFDSSQWSKEIWKRRKSESASFAWDVNNENSGLGSFFENDQRTMEIRDNAHQQWVRAGGKAEVFETRELLLNEAKEVLNELRSTSGGHATLTPQYLQNIMSRAEDNRINPNVLVGKLHSARDAVQSVSRNKSTRFLVSDEAQPINGSSYTPVSENAVGFRKKLGTVMQRPYLVLEDDVLRAITNVHVPNFEPFEIAFYLYRDGIKVDQIWYSELNSGSFETPVLDGVYEVQSFVRYTNKPFLSFRRKGRKYVAKGGKLS